MALNKTGKLIGNNTGDEHGLFPQYTQPEVRSGAPNVHNNIPKQVGGKISVNNVRDGVGGGRVLDTSRNRESRFGLNRENGHVRYEDLTNILGLRMNSESFSDISDFIPNKHPAAQEIENGVSPNILSKTQKGDGENSGLGALRKTFSETICDKTGTRQGVSSPIYRHERSHSNGFSGSGTLDDSLSGGKMKFLCSFGGKILPRPGDGKLRYVGGETHIISIRNDISWQELMNKTLGICSQPHTIKYQLPGEDLDALISVSSDEDLQNMIEEYHGLESHEGSQKLRIFLVPLGESEESPSANGNTVLQNNPDYQYVVALNGVIDHSPKKIISGPSLTNEANHSAKTFNFTPIVTSSPLEIRDGNSGMNALNLQSPLRISPTPVQVAGSNTGYIQLLGNNSCQGSIDSNASFVTAQIYSGNSSINTADCRYPQQPSATLVSDSHPRQHGNVGQPKNLNGQYFDNYSTVYASQSNGYGDEALGGTLHKDTIFYSGNSIAQQTESYGTNNDTPHGMSHAFSDSQLHESGAKSGYCSQEGINPSLSLNLEKSQLSSLLGVSKVNLKEGQHDPFLHYPQIQSKIPNVESTEMHRWQGAASSYSESVRTDDRINKDSIVEKDMRENSRKPERMMINEQKNPILKKDNKVCEVNSTVDYMSELYLLDTFPTNNVSAKIGMQNNWEQPFADTHPSSSGMMGLSLNNLVDKTPSDLHNTGQKTSDGRNIDFSAGNIDLNSPIPKCAESPCGKSTERDHMLKFSFDPHSLKSAQIQPSQNQIATGFHDNPAINSDSLYPAVLRDDVRPCLNLPVDGLDNSSKNISFVKAPSFLDDLITSIDQTVDHFKHEHSASGLSKVEGVILEQSKNLERCNDANRVEPFLVVDDVTGVVPSRPKSSPVHTSHDFDEVGSDVSPSHTEVESTVPESDPEVGKTELDLNLFIIKPFTLSESFIFIYRILKTTKPT